MKLLLCCLLLLTAVIPSKNRQTADPASAEFRKLDIEFLSNGIQLKGWLYLPGDTTATKLPAVVMAPGFSGTKECNYQFFAENFVKAGLAVLLFDYPNFGESGGEPRGEVDPWQQIQAYRDGISFLDSRIEIDDKRIGVWGGSYAGGHAIVLSAIDTRVRCMVAMTPFISGHYFLEQIPAENKAFLLDFFNADRTSRIHGIAPVIIPVASAEDKKFTAISSPNAWKFIQSFKDYAPTYQNFVTLKSLELQLEYEPGAYIQQMRPIPKLFIIARNDEIMPEQLIVDAYSKASEPKKLEYIDGHHFSPYMEGLPAASKLAVDWFKSHL